MSREEKINKMIEEIKIRRNDEQYRGGPFPIYHIEFDILNEEIERLNNIINEGIEYIEDNSDDMHTYISQAITQILKGSDKEWT